MGKLEELVEAALIRRKALSPDARGPIVLIIDPVDPSIPEAQVPAIQRQPTPESLAVLKAFKPTVSEAIH